MKFRGSVYREHAGLVAFGSAEVGLLGGRCSG